MCNENSTIIEDYKKSLLAEVKNFSENELDNFLKYEKNEEDQKKLKEKIVNLEESIYPKIEILDEKRLKKEEQALEELEKKILSEVKKDGNKWTKALRDSITLLKEKEKAVLPKKEKFDKKEKAKKEEFDKKEKEISDKKIKRINCLMIGGSILIILLSILKLDSFSLIASVASIMALFFTLITYIFSKEALEEQVEITRLKRMIEPFIIGVPVFLVVSIPIYIYPQWKDLVNWLGSIATVIAFLLGIIFYRYQKLVIDWWKTESFGKRTYSFWIQCCIAIIGLIYFIFPFIISFHTIKGTIDFTDTEKKHIAKIELIKEKNGKKREIASTTTDNNGYFAFQCPIRTDKEKTELLIAYDPESSVEHSNFFDDFFSFSQTLVSLFRGNNKDISNDFWYKNKINYQTDNPVLDDNNIFKIDNRGSIVGNWYCSLKDSPTKFIWKIDHYKDDIIIRQRESKTCYDTYFNEKRFKYDYKNNYFSPIERTDMGIHGKITKEGKITIDLSSPLGIVENDIITCIPCSK